MSRSSSASGFTFGIAVHAVALGALLVFGGEATDITSSSADPILLMLGGDDPNKDAGLVGRERGVARGTQDGKLFDPGAFSQERLNELTEQNKRLAAEEAAAERAQQEAEEAARKAAEQAAREKAARERAAREAAAREAAKPKPPSRNNNSGGKPSAEKVDIRTLVKNQNRGSGNKPKNNQSGRGSGKRISDVRVAGGGGDVLGKPDGTGGNGGDGGSRVADARELYVEAVKQRFNIHFENVVAQNPVSIPDSVTIDARFSVDANGNIRFLEVIGSNDPQIRDRVRKTFERAFPSRFQRPPNGAAFTGRLKRITFSVY